MQAIVQWNSEKFKNQFCANGISSYKGLISLKLMPLLSNGQKYLIIIF